MENSNQRMFRLLGNKRGVQAELANYIGVSKSNITTWKTRGNDLPSEYIPKIAEFLNVSETYLLTGKEDNKDKTNYFTQEEIKLIMVYRNLDPAVKNFVFNSITAQEQLVEARKSAESYKEKYKQQVLSAHSELAK